MALTKLDVLSAFDELFKIYVAYECDGKTYDYFPMQQKRAVPCQAGVQTIGLAGRAKDITKARASRTAGKRAGLYRELERLSGVKATIISVGPDRDQTFTRGW